MRILALAFVLFSGAPAHAGPACLEVDVREQLGPPRVQDGTSWCYAHSAADLLSQSIRQRISSIDLATAYLMGDETKLAKLKDPAMKDYLRLHPDFVAHLRESRKEEDAYSPEHILSPEGIVDTGGRDDEAIVLANLKGLCLSSRLPAGPDNVSKYLQAIRADSLKTDSRDEASLGPIGAVENDVARIMAHAFEKWVDQKCGKRIRPKAPILPHAVSVADSLEEFLRMTKAEKIDLAQAHALLWTELDRVLDTGKAAAIAYDAYDLYPREDAKVNTYHGDHSSIVAARKMIDGQCHYFVRNHFGPTCGYLPRYEARCEKENGGVWIPSEALRHLYSVISVR